jgi:hypothetical protein
MTKKSEREAFCAGVPRRSEQLGGQAMGVPQQASLSASGLFESDCIQAFFCVGQRSEAMTERRRTTPMTPRAMPIGMG